jgi:membrane protease subunit (stomatin/prohibitin family)
VLDFAAHYRELGEEIRKVVMERVDDEYGLEIPQLYIVNISVPAEVEQALDARTSMNAIGDMAAFQGYQLGQAMPVAAANPAGGLAGAGVGLGMGLGIAQTMGAAPTQVGSSPSAQIPQPPPPPVPSWHIAVNGQTQGPFTPEQIAEGIAAGQVRGDTLVWSAGMATWATANRVPSFAALFQPAPPPPPVTAPDNE